MTLQNNFVLFFPRKNSPAPHSGAHRGQMVLAVSQFVSSLWGRQEDETDRILQCLNLSAPDRELLKRGICSYLLPGQEALQRGVISTRPPASAFKKYVSPEILKVCCILHRCIVCVLQNSLKF